MSTPPLRSLRYPKLPSSRVADALAGELRDRILRNEYEAGATLPTQNQLVDEFGVSYPSVREAMRILEAEGLITVRRGNLGGATIHRPDANSAAYALGLALESERVTVRDLATCLLVFEPMCAAICARDPKRHRTIVPSLFDNIAATERCVEDGEAFTHEARRFHDLIVSLIDNRTTRLVVRSLVSLWTAHEESWAAALHSRGEYFNEADRREVIEVHRRIAARIKAGDAEAAERAARRHLAVTQQLYLDRFDNVVVDASSTKTNLFRPVV